MPPKKRGSIPTEEISEPTAGPPTPSGVSGNTTSNDDTDVEAALSRDTQDGKGGEVVPPPDFESFATEEVESAYKPASVLAQEVLRGLWGDYVGLRDRLDDAGHIATEVLTLVNERLVRGAPSAFRASNDEVVNQIEHGEWGDNPRALESRLLGAGFKAVDVFEILKDVRRG